MRLTLVISSLQGGGAERVMTTMANHWAAAGWTITLLTLDDGTAPLFYELDNRVRRLPLAVAKDSSNAIAAFRNTIKRVRALRHAIRDSRPDVVLSFMDTTNVITILATRAFRVPVVVSERSDPESNNPGKLWSLLRQMTYPLADALVVQSKGAFDYFSPSVQSRAHIIPNPVLFPVLRNQEASIEIRKPFAAAMGRMVRAKGFDLLLRAFAQIKDKHSKWSLAILGDGPLRGEIEMFRDELGLCDRVVMPGRVSNPYEVLSQADLFVMSSRYEGFPNALCEAMASGLAVISTDCPSGPREIIRDEIDGLLVLNQDVTMLANAMDRLMSNETERAMLGARACEVTRRFSLDEVARIWERVLVSSIIRRLPGKDKAKLLVNETSSH
ncbi:MAG TPA: glycosyltransferase family 4 protein [Blastocatellia bacterium]|nr:glycosyltransferase family 4 protein [Blastocatellia bacterium]